MDDRLNVSIVMHRKFLLWWQFVDFLVSSVYTVLSAQNYKSMNLLYPFCPVLVISFQYVIPKRPQFFSIIIRCMELSVPNLFKLDTQCRLQFKNNIAQDKLEKEIFLKVMEDLTARKGYQDLQ